MAILILKIPGLGTEDVGNALEWVFYVIFPNFCFSKALQDLNIKHQFTSICSQIDEYVNQTTFCQMISNNNQTNPCCPGKYQNAFIHLSIHTFVHSFIHSFPFFIHSFVHSFTYHSFIRSFVHSFIHSLIIHLFVHSFIHSLIPVSYTHLTLPTNREV